MAEYNEMKGHIREMIPSEEDNRRKEVARRHVLHVLANEKVRLNDTIGKNRTLKVDIDIMRKEIVFARDSIEKMENQIDGLKRKIKGLNQETVSGNRIADETNNQILAMKAQHEEEKERFETIIK
jgi:chromosome segregation ATPase